MLRIQDLSAAYGVVRALDGVSLEVETGEMVTLIGANGAGKTTLLRTVSGLLRPLSGTVEFNGTNIGHQSPEHIAALGVCQVPEGRRIFPQLTVGENLNIGAYLRRDKDGVRRDLDYCFELFPILAKRRKQPGGSLSGGEQQMLAISRTLLQQPRVLLLDEPSLGLAPLLVRQIFEVIARINREQKVGVLLVEQNANLALKTAHRGYVLEHGRMILSGASDSLLTNPDVRRAYLGLA